MLNFNMCWICPEKLLFTHFKSLRTRLAGCKHICHEDAIKRYCLSKHLICQYVKLYTVQASCWNQNQCHSNVLLPFSVCQCCFSRHNGLILSRNKISDCTMTGLVRRYGCIQHKSKQYRNIPHPSVTRFIQQKQIHSFSEDFSLPVTKWSSKSSVIGCWQIQGDHNIPRLMCSRTKRLHNILRNSNTRLCHVRNFSVKISDGSEDHPVSITAVRKFLQEHNMRVEQGYTCLSTVCPKMNLQKEKMTGSEKIFINMTTGFFQCGHCRKSGQWGALEDNLRVLAAQKRKKDFECLKDVGKKYPAALDSVPLLEQLKHSKLMEDVSEDEYFSLQTTFKFQNLRKVTLGRYGIHYDTSTRTLLFPVYTSGKVLVALKKMTAYTSQEGLLRSVREQSFPRSGPMELFGWPMHTEETDEVVLTTSEFDTMAVQQEIGVLSLALPRGYSVLPQEILPSLEKFKKIVLWFGSDVRAWEAAKQLAKKINEKRCFVIRPSSDAPSPLLALQQNLNLKRILSNARAMTHQSIVSFPQLRQEVFSELSHVEQVAGIKWKRYPTLNKLLKGHRRGELTVFTGPTGSGKTTFISDYSLDLCMQGVNTLWGSFEINNVRLAKTMLTQFSQRNLCKKLNEFDYWADKFEHLPMFFMTFYGQENIKKVIETMSHAVYVHDIAHVVVDNLQFMMGIESEKVDRFHKQDMIIASFRKFASNMNCHVTLVIHPRKEKDADDLTTASIFGSAKASQEADNVLILQDKRLVTSRGRKYIQVTKNRFDGELGIMLLKFDRDTLSFAIRDVKDKTKPDETKTDQ